MTYPWAAGEVLTAADLNDFPSGVYRSTATFSAVTTASFSNVFDPATFSRYRVTVTGDGSSTGGLLYARFRTGTTDTTSSTYLWAYHGRSNVAALGGGSGSDTAMFLGYSRVFYYILDFFFNAASSQFYARLINNSFSYSGDWVSITGIGSNTNSSAFNGFTLFANAGTITGDVHIYGYNQ